MSYEDRTLTCVDCSVEFEFTAAEQARYAERGFSHEPKRCRPCREKRRAKNDTGGGGGGEGMGAGGRPRSSGMGGGGGGAGRERRGFGGGGGAGADRPKRKLYPATCAACGQETTVPFQPTTGRPVYCRDCFTAAKP